MVCRHHNHVTAMMYYQKLLRDDCVADVFFYITDWSGHYDVGRKPDFLVRLLNVR